MAAIVLPHRWRRQPPPGAVDVDWANPISGGLLALAVHPSLPNPVTGRGWERGIGTKGITATPVGWLTKAGGGAYTTLVDNLPVGNAPRTLICWYRRTSAATTADTWCGYGTVASNQQWTLGYFNSAIGSLCFANDLTTAFTASEQTRMMVCTHDGTTARLYIDGVLVNSSAKNYATTNLNSRLGVGGSGSQFGASGSPVADNGAVSLYNRALSAAEVQELFIAPWQVVRPLQRRIWVDLGASGSHTLTGANATQPGASSTGAITQVHVLAGAPSTQAATSSTGAISVGVVHNLAGAGAAQAATSSTDVISQVHRLVAALSVQDAIAAASPIVQAHMLVAAASIQSALSQAVSLDGDTSGLTGSAQRIGMSSLQRVPGQIGTGAIDNAGIRIGTTSVGAPSARRIGT